MWGRSVDFITFFVICPGQGRFSRIARFIQGREGWARSGSRRGSGTRELVRGEDGDADVAAAARANSYEERTDVQ